MNGEVLEVVFLVSFLIEPLPSYSKEKDPDVMFIGDCILETLQFTEIWNQSFAPMHCLNFSISNDRVENVLWRIENGELDNVNPKVCPESSLSLASLPPKLTVVFCRL